MHPSYRSPLPIVWTLLGTLLCFAVWLLMFPVDRPSGIVKFDPAPRRWLTELPSANALVQVDGNPSADALLVVGDSRASAAISLRWLERDLERPAAVLWYGFGQYDLLFEAVDSLPPRTLLVCLTPAALYTPPLPRMQVLLDRERSKTWMMRLDDQLDGSVDVTRQQWLRPIDPSYYKTWTKLDAIEPERQVGVYIDLLAQHKPERLAGYQRLRTNLARLQQRGYRIACVRLPVMSKLEMVEDREFDPRLWREMCAELGLPYLDGFGSGDRFGTSDGSHLVGRDGEVFTIELGKWLKEQRL